MNKRFYIGLFLSIIILMTACTSKKEETKENLKLEKDSYACDFVKYQKDEVIKSKYFEINIVKDSVVPKNFGTMWDIVAEDVMKLTGLKFYPDGDISKNRININIQRKHRASVANEKEVNITEEEALLWNGTSHVLAHELTHCIQYRNFRNFDRMIDEGYANYITRLYYKNSTLPTFYSLHHTIAEYQLPDVSVLEQTVAKKSIFSEDQPMMEYYGMGLRLVTFLQETYGKDAILKLFEKLKSQNITEGKQVTVMIKEITSNDVFVKFSEWNKINKDKMEKTEPVVDYTNTKTLYITPLRYEDVWNTEKEYSYYYFFDNVNGYIKNDIVLDFAYGYKYFNLSENETLTQIAAKFTTDKDCKLKYYDKNRKIIKTKEVKAGETVDIQDGSAYYIKIQGACTFKFVPIWDQMLPSELVLPEGMK